MTTATQTHFFDSFADINAEDYDMGNKVVSVCIGFAGTLISLALAYACSSAILAVVVFLISAVVLYLLSILAGLYIGIAHGAKVEAIGRVTNNAVSRVKGLFRRG